MDEQIAESLKQNSSSSDSSSDPVTGAVDDLTKGCFGALFKFFFVAAAVGAVCFLIYGSFLKSA